MRWMRMRLAAAAGLAGLAGPVSALAALDGDGFVAVAAQFEGVDVPGVVEALGDRVNVTVSGIKTKGVELGPTYADDFSYEAMMFGSATGFYGGGFGTLTGSAEAEPEEVESLDGGSPLANPHTSVVDGTIQVSFIETAVVTGPAPGTPVTLEVNFLLESSSAFGGGNLSFPHDARATFFGRVIDNSAGFVGVERAYFADNFETIQFATAVGHELSLEGRFGLFVEGTTGRGNGFVSNLDAAVDGTGTLYLGVPKGFGVAAVSGHDYTLPVPEPAGLLLALTGAAALASHRVARGAGPSGRAS